MNKKTILVMSVLFSASILGSSCGARVEPTPTVDPQAVLTEVAMTISAELTQSALLTPSPTATTAPTMTPPPIPTQALPPAPTVPVEQPGINSTLAGPLPDNWTYISDTIKDGTVFWKNEKFVQTWKFENTGSTTWNTNYQLVYWAGDLLGDITTVSLTNPVAPGVQVEISVPMVAPAVEGKTYKSWWTMINDKGQPFPSGEYLWVEIYVGTVADKTPTPAG